LTAFSGADALLVVQRERPDLVLMDIRMPGRDGIEVCRQLKHDPATRLMPIVLMTGFSSAEDRIGAIEAGADDFLAKPVDVAELRARVKSLVRLKRYTDDLDSAESVIMSLARTIEARDPNTEGHCERLARFAVTLGARLGLSEDDLAALHRGGHLHDIGKVAVPDAVLRKPGPLTDEEYDVIKRHTVVGDELLGSLRSMRRVRSVVRHHHERLDGTGYPDGLKGEDVPLLAQIVGVVDVYDALTSIRPYKPAWSPLRAYEALREEVAKGWRRADLVELLISLGESGQLGVPWRQSVAPDGATG
jgi:putative two-component system response regulator